ncbi:MAG TPA: hypothetical protein VIS76_17665 [Pseudomonadales bacterium]
MSERPTRVHVVGCHRSGTTLMMELLWYAYPFSGRCEHEATLFRPVPADETLYLTKKPPDTIRIERAFLADEKLHVVAMIRDPRSVATSRHAQFPDVYFSGFRRWLEYLDVIERLSGHPRWLTVRYEDLTADPAAVQEAIETRFPFLERRRAFTAYPEGADVPERAGVSLGGARRLDPTRSEGWRAHLPRIRAQLDAYPVVAEKIKALGYERDDAWRACLEGVEPHRQDYRKDDPAHFFRDLETRARFWWKTRRYLRSL